MEIKFKQDDEEIASCDIDILMWEKEIEELQSKVKRAKKRKTEPKNVSQTELNKEALIGLQHFNNVSPSNMEIEGITSTISLTDLQLEVAKAQFKRLKATPPF